jgi:hypothetical protein
MRMKERMKKMIKKKMKKRMKRKKKRISLMKKILCFQISLKILKRRRRSSCR